ncbi:tRNA (adenosine(37)-N6)-threonylcarbamoyltransferase complex dimerization subunit type 1 TsaB [Patescibacteria group bacterium]|nr:tRNA (adenosine(37)-N6)-threonylcarbamoyltransferase complex dimerization subunit type 1 TsaB [Patescibacteria group bacterium]
MTLSINTSNFKHTEIALIDNGRPVAQKTFKTKKNLGRLLLPKIDTLLKESNVELSDLTNIQVNTGPGSFTGLRIGIAIANTFAFTLGIPVNNLPLGQTATPQYGKKPNISSHRM